jgi:outer membrane lipoprotein SlyB
MKSAFFDTTTPVTLTEYRRPHPVMLAAAIAVIVFSLLGVGAITGLIPSANSAKNDAETSTASPANHLKNNSAGCAQCGIVEAIRAVQSKGSGSGLGAVAGGVTGAVVGNQMGRGNGNTVMTLLGAAGGAFAGNAIEKNVNSHTTYRTTVRMDDGSYRTVSSGHQPAVGIGDKVKIVDGNLVLRS